MFASYRSALNRYCNFRICFQLPLFPLTSHNMTRFVAYLARAGIVYPTIRAYLSVIRFMQIIQGLPDPCLASDPMLAFVLRGVRRLPIGDQQHPRLQINHTNDSSIAVAVMVQLASG